MIPPHASLLLADAASPTSGGIINMHAWPLAAILALMIVAATADGCLLKVPNKITFPIILAGWALALYYDIAGAPLPLKEGEVETGFRLVASIANTMFACFLLIFVYAFGGVGAGDVKMQMGFGAWVGAYLGLYTGMEVVWYAFLAGVVIGGILGVLKIVFLGGLKEHMQNAREILQDFATLGSISKVAEKAKERKSKLWLIPYGIPLCIGYISYLLYRYNW